MTQTRVLTIAGADPSGGAGVAADLKVFATFGCRGAAVTAGLTAQSSRGVRRVWAVPDGAVAAQLDALFEDGPPAAAKAGMLASADAVEAVVRAFADGRIPLIVDPVVASSAGVRLIDDEAERAALGLVAIAALVTPNAVEAAATTGLAVADVAGAVAAARRLLELGARAALVKGGHLPGPSVVDVLVVRGCAPVLFERPRVERSRRVRGTGCALSAAVAAGLARGLALEAAVRVAGDYVHAAIVRAYDAGDGALTLDRTVRVAGMPS